MAAARHAAPGPRKTVFWSVGGGLVRAVRSAVAAARAHVVGHADRSALGQSPQCYIHRLLKDRLGSSITGNPRFHGLVPCAKTRSATDRTNDHPSVKIMDSAVRDGAVFAHTDCAESACNVVDGVPTQAST